MFTSVLMIEKALTPEDVRFLTTLHGAEPVSFVVLMQPRGDQSDVLLRAIDDVAYGGFEEAARESEEPEGGEARRPAEIALEQALAALGGQGAQARGEVVEKHPLDRLGAVVKESAADEVIVLTEPHYVEEFFHRDWASRARHIVGVPVLKLFAHSE